MSYEDKRKKNIARLNWLAHQKSISYETILIMAMNFEINGKENPIEKAVAMAESLFIGDF